jgi:hypothetical protein
MTTVIVNDLNVNDNQVIPCTGHVEKQNKQHQKKKYFTAHRLHD